MKHVKCILLVKKSSTKCGNFISQVHNIEVKWSIKPCIVQTKTIIKALRQKLIEWIMKNSNMYEYTIARVTLLITDAESWVKRRVLKLLMECSMRQLFNEIIDSPDYGSLLGWWHANKNDVIISDSSSLFSTSSTTSS